MAKLAYDIILKPVITEKSYGNAYSGQRTLSRLPRTPTRSR